MKDEVIDILAPEIAERYRRWRPRLTFLQAVAVVLGMVGLVVVLSDGGQSCEARNLAIWLLIIGTLVWVTQAVAERIIGRRLSDMGIMFSTTPRKIMTGLWFVASINTLAATDLLYSKRRPGGWSYSICGYWSP